VKVLHLDSGADWRGGQQQIDYLVRGLSRLGVEQHLVLCEKGELARRIGQSGLSVSALPFSSELAPASILKMREAVRLFEPAIIHAHDSRTLGMAAVLNLLGQPAKLIAVRRVAFPIRKDVFWKFKYQKSVDKIIAVSKFSHQQLVQAGLPPGKIELVYDGYACKETESKAGRAQARRKLGLAEGDWVLGCMGQFTSEKGHEVLIRGVKKLLDESWPVRLVLAGEGPLRERYLTLIRGLGLENQVILPGFVTDPTSLLPAFDVFVFPSLNEGLGSTLLMVMAHHIPVCASQAGGIPELVIDGQTGSLFPPGDSSALAKVVRRNLEDKARAQSMAQAAYCRATSDFTVERMVSETYKVYANVLTG
jgi:L-malate glycosyltransferase